MFKKKRTYIILILIIAVIGGVYYLKSKKPEIEYTTAIAQKGDLVRTVSVTGKIVAPIEADLSFKLSGRVESLLVKIGDQVKKGQKLATIDRGTLLQKLAQAEREINVQKQTLYNMKKRNETYNSYEREAQRLKIKKAEEAVDEIKKEIYETALYSPIDGTVIKKNVEVGETTVANAVTAATSVYTIASGGDLETKVDVPESDIVKIEIGQKAQVALDAFSSDEKLEAQVVEIEPASTVIQDVVYYKVKLKFASPDSRMKVGMSVDADINTAEKDNIIMIPIRAVRTEGSQEYVEILKSNNMVERKNVKTGISGDNGMVEIISGLSGGENVVTLAKTP